MNSWPKSKLQTTVIFSLYIYALQMQQQISVLMTPLVSISFKVEPAGQTDIHSEVSTKSQNDMKSSTKTALLEMKRALH